MNFYSFALVLCFCVVLSARLTMAINSFELHTLMNKLDYLKDKMQEVEQTMKTTMEISLKEMEQRMQEKLIKHENNINEKFKIVDNQFEKRMYAMEDSLKKSTKKSEQNTMTNLEEVKYQLVSRMDNLQLQLTAESTTIQEKAQTELKQLVENKKSLDMLTDSVRNISTLSEKSKTILEAQFINPVRSCGQVTSASGTYLFRLWKNSKPFEVFCEQHKFDGGWTVIQHRFDGSLDFYRNWTEYRNGFGNVDGEFWLGLEYVHQLTKNRPHELLVEMKDFHGYYGYSKFNMFEIGSETEMYELKKLGTYSGTAGDSLSQHKNKKFSTFDRDNYGYSGYNCAKRRHGAWWYDRCHNSHLNGRYRNTADDASAMVWYYFKNDNRGLSFSRIMIRDIIN